MSLFSRWQASSEPAPSDGHIYLIDTENVKAVWTVLLERMSDSDKVYVFYTMNSGNVSYEALTGILQYGKQVELVECFTGKNGLDFQLVSYLGYLIRDNEEGDYCIVSDDGGFDAAIKFWDKKGIKVSRKTASAVSGKPPKTSRAKAVRPSLKSRSGVRLAGGGAEAVASAASASRPDASGQTGNAPFTGSTASRRRSSASSQGQGRKDTPESAALQSAMAQMQDAGMVASVPGGEDDYLKFNAQAVAKPAEVSREALVKYLPAEDADRIEQIIELLIKAGGPENLADIHDGIEKIYRDDRSTEVYRTIRPHLKEIYGTRTV